MELRALRQHCGVTEAVPSGRFEEIVKIVEAVVLCAGKDLATVRSIGSTPSFPLGTLPQHMLDGFARTAAVRALCRLTSIERSGGSWINVMEPVTKRDGTSHNGSDNLGVRRVRATKRDMVIGVTHRQAPPGQQVLPRKEIDKLRELPEVSPGALVRVGRKRRGPQSTAKL